MDVIAVKELIDRAALRDLVICRDELAAIGTVRAMLAARETQVLCRLRQLGADLEGEHSAQTRSSGKNAARARRRADAAEQVPQLTDALSAGETTSEHVDVVAEALAGLNAEDRDRSPRTVPRSVPRLPSWQRASSAAG